MTRRGWFPGVALLLLLLGAGGAGDGLAAWHEARWADAQAAWAAAAGPGDAEGWINVALAAVRAGEPEACEVAAEKAAAYGGPRFERLRDFLLGNAAFVRGERAAVLAALPEAGPPAFDLAIAELSTAIGWWERCALGDEDWPAARRNVERARRRLQDLERRREEAGARTSAGASREERPRLVPEGGSESNPAGGAPTEEEVTPELRLGDLAPSQVRNLLERLAEKEAERRALRRERRRASRARGERDW